MVWYQINEMFESILGESESIRRRRQISIPFSRLKPRLLQLGASSASGKHKPRQRHVYSIVLGLGLVSTAVKTLVRNILFEDFQPRHLYIDELLGEASGLDHRLEEAAAQSAAP